MDSKKGSKIVSAAIVIAMMIIIGARLGMQSASAQESGPGDGQLIGGQKDAHGCLIAAGYSWNETGQVCMRPWSGEVQTDTYTDDKGTPVNRTPDNTDQDMAYALGSEAPANSSQAVAAVSPLETFFQVIISFFQSLFRVF